MSIADDEDIYPIAKVLDSIVSMVNQQVVDLNASTEAEEIQFRVQQVQYYLDNDMSKLKRLAESYIYQQLERLEWIRSCEQDEQLRSQLWESYPH